MDEISTKINLPGTDLSVTRIAFGLWGLAGPPFWEETAESEAIALLRRAYDTDINFFDTAPVYGMGYGEELLGKAFPPAQYPDVVIATKVGLSWKMRTIEGIYHDLKAKTVRREVEDSLRRLRREVIDLYQVHWPDPETPPEETFTELSRLKEEGKIRHIGVSNFTVEMLKEARKYADISTVQNRYNLLDRKAEASLLPYCAKRNIGTLIYSPLASGMLTGKYDLNAKTGDWRDRDFSDLFKPEARKKALELVATLKKISEETGFSVTQLALLWVMLNPQVSVAIAGIKKEKHLKEIAELLLISEGKYERIVNLLSSL